MLDVDPEARELLSRRAFALRDFVLMMRKDQIHAAGVNIDGCRSEQPKRHRGALDVPAGTAGTDPGVPRRLAFLRGFPEHEVARVLLLVFVRVDPCAALDA